MLQRRKLTLMGIVHDHSAGTEWESDLSLHDNQPEGGSPLKELPEPSLANI